MSSATNQWNGVVYVLQHLLHLRERGISCLHTVTHTCMHEDVKKQALKSSSLIGPCIPHQMGVFKALISVRCHCMSTLTCLCVCVLKDLLYEHSISVGDSPPRLLYKGRDFQYYFSLPSGDPNDDYKGEYKHTHTHIHTDRDTDL